MSEITDAPTPPAPAKPPRRMLQPTKNTLRDEIRYLEAKLLEQRNTIQTQEIELQAMRDTNARMWLEHHKAPEPRPSFFDRLVAWLNWLMPHASRKR